MMNKNIIMAASVVLEIKGNIAGNTKPITAMLNPLKVTNEAMGTAIILAKTVTGLMILK